MSGSGSRPSSSAVDTIDVLVVGAGVVGLAIARELARAGRGVVIAEAEGGFGSGVSSRNSEVIHAGLYYPPGSLKARLCVRGKALLYEFAAGQGAPGGAAGGFEARRCGKLIVATRPEDEAKLEVIARRGAANGVDDLVPLSRTEARALEPALECAAALLSPSSGIVDSHGFMTALLADAEAHGALLAVKSRFVAAEPRPRAAAAGWRAVVTGEGDDAATLDASWIVNAAGLDAQAVAAAMAGFPREHVPRRHLAKGHYFSLAGRAPFSRLVYPTPVDGGLGVHLTLDLGGQARFGPDVQWLDDDGAPGLPGAALDYAVDPSRADAFYAEVRRYWPALPDGALLPAYSGIRPKIGGPGSTEDFRIDGPATHGVPGVVQLFGIESPGLTASMAIAEVVAGIVAEGG